MLLLKLSHPVVAGVIQLAVYFLTGNEWIGGLIGLAVFAGREHAQAEYRWIERFGKRFESAADYAEWHYRTHGFLEGREAPASWNEYLTANPDVQVAYAAMTGLRSNMPLLGGFDPKVWQMHSILGVVLPAIAVVALGLFL